MNLPFLKKPLQPFFSALAVCWLIYGYYRYLSSPTSEVSIQLLARFKAVIASDGVVDIFNHTRPVGSF